MRTRLLTNFVSIERPRNVIPFFLINSETPRGSHSTSVVFPTISSSNSFRKTLCRFDTTISPFCAVGCTSNACNAFARTVCVNVRYTTTTTTTAKPSGTRKVSSSSPPQKKNLVRKKKGKTSVKANVSSTTSKVGQRKSKSTVAVKSEIVPTFSQANTEVPKRKGTPPESRVEYMESFEDDVVDEEKDHSMFHSSREGNDAPAVRSKLTSKSSFDAQNSKDSSTKKSPLSGRSDAKKTTQSAGAGESKEMEERDIRAAIRNIMLSSSNLYQEENTDKLQHFREEKRLAQIRYEARNNRILRRNQNTLIAARETAALGEGIVPIAMHTSSNADSFSDLSENGITRIHSSSGAPNRDGIASSGRGLWRRPDSSKARKPGEGPVSVTESSDMGADKTSSLFSFGVPVPNLSVYDDAYDKRVSSLSAMEREQEVVEERRRARMDEREKRRETLLSRRQQPLDAANGEEDDSPSIDDVLSLDESGDGDVLSKSMRPEHLKIAQGLVDQSNDDEDDFFVQSFTEEEEYDKED